MIDPQAEFMAQINAMRADVEELQRASNRSVDSAIGTFTVTVTQTNTPTQTTNYASWRRCGGIVHWAFSVSFTSAGTSGAAILVSWAGMPAAVAPLPHAAGMFEYFDTGVAFYVGDVRWNTSSQWFFRAHLGTSNLGVDPNFAIANGDVLSAAGWYFA